MKGEDRESQYCFLNDLEVSLRTTLTTSCSNL